MKPALRVESLSVHSTENNDVIVYPISFQLNKGVPVNLLGETGAGKSLIAQAILGNLADTLQATGKVWINEVEYLSKPKHERQKLWGRVIGLLPQEPWLSLDPTKRSIHQLAEVYELVLGRKKSPSIQAATRDLSRFALTGSEKKFPHELSGGMAQRLVFCCTMAGGTTILLVDEPTKGLDSDLKKDVIRQLKDFVDDDRYLLVITHDVEVAEQLGGETIVIQNGIMVEKNETPLLLGTPQNTYTKSLIESAPKNWDKFSFSVPREKAVVSCKDISKSRSGHLLFSQVNLTIHRGEIVGLYGPSGSGKSTLGDILLGLIRPNNGQVYRNQEYSPYQFLKLYQDPPSAFSPFHTLHSTIQDLLDLHRLTPSALMPLMEKLNLDKSILERDPANISGGELQRISIMRSLLLSPVFLFADEPTSRLDLVTQKETVALLCATARETNCGILLVSHNFTLLEKSCDSIFNLVQYISTSTPYFAPEKAAV